MGLDYSYALIFKRQDVWQLLEAVAKLSSQGTKHTSILFPDHTLKLPLEAWADTPEQLFFDDLSDQIQFMTCLDFTPDEALIDYADRYNNKPNERPDGTTVITIGVIYLTVFNDPGDWGGEQNSDLIVLQFMAATSNMSILFCESTSIRAAMIGLLEQNEGLYGILDREDAAELIWWHGQEVSVELDHAYLKMAEIEQLVPPERKTAEDSGLSAQFCLSCGREFEPPEPGELLCAECRRESPTRSETLVEVGFKTMLEPELASQPEVAYCIVHGGEFIPSSPGEVVCPMCAGKAVSEPSLAGGATELDAPATYAPAAFKGRQAEWQPGDELLDTYTVSGLLGAGGMGNVYRVHHNTWNIDLAVKSPHAQFFQTQEQREIFISEAETWVKLGLHPHITTCYYVRNINDMPRIFAELVEGGSLADWIEQGKITTVEQALDIAIQFAWGLAYAHEQGVVHRDVKPANVLMAPDGTAKVTDFGLAKAGKGMTPAYASPEQAEAQLRNVELTPQSDLWSWGLSVLEMFAGRAFWVRQDMPDYAWGQVAPQALEHYLCGEVANTPIQQMPSTLAVLLRQCFLTEISARPAGMGRVAERLNEIYAAEIGSAFQHTEPEGVELRADSLNNKALSFLDIGKDEQAEGFLRETLEINPQHAEAIYNYNLIRWRKGEISDVEMVEILQGSVRNQPDIWKPWYHLALVHQEREDQQKTAEILTQIKALGKGKPDPEKDTALGTFQAPDDNWLGLIHETEAHKDTVISVAITPDGKMGISSAGHPGYVTEGDNTIRLWDMQNLNPLGVLQGHDGNVNALAALPDSQRLLSAGADGTLRLWDLNQRACLAEMRGHEGDVICLAISSDGNVGFSGGDDGRVGVWDLSLGKLIRFLPAQKSKIISIAARQDKRTLAVGYGSDYLGEHERAKFFGSDWIPITLWDYRSAKCLHTFEPEDDERSTTTGLAFVPGKRLLLSTGNVFRTAYMQLWDIDTHQLIKQFDGYELYVNVLSLSQDGKWILAGSRTESSPLKIWDARTHQCLHTVKRDLGGLDLTGDQLAQLGIGGVGKGDIAKLLTASIGEIHSAVFSPKSNRLLIGGSNGSLMLWQFNPHPIRAPFAVCRPQSTEQASVEAQRARGLIEQARQEFERKQISKAHAAAKEARTINGFERDPHALEILRGVASFAQVSNLRGAWQAGIIRMPRESQINCLAFSPDGKWLACGSEYNRFFMVELPGNQVKAEQMTFGGAVRLGFSEDGKSLGVASYRSGWWAHFQEFDLDTLELKKETKLGKSHKDAVFSRDFKWAINLIWDNQQPMELWDLNGGEEPRTFGFHEEGPTRLELLPDETRVITASGPESSFSPQPVNDSLRVWEISTGKLVTMLSTPTQRVPRALAVSPNGRLALSGGYSDYQVYCWDIDDGILKWSSPYHKEQIAGLAFHPSGKFAASGAHDQKIVIWRIDDGKRLFTLEGHDQDITDVVFSPDGHWLATSAGKDAVLLWYLDWELKILNPQDWNEGARDYLNIFLTLQTPYASDGFTRRGKPTWVEGDFNRLLYTLGTAGYGWLRPEGVRRKLEEMASERG